MDKLTKIMSNKIIVITTTFVLTLAYIGLVKVYAEGFTNDLNTKTKSYGRNASDNFTDLVDKTNTENKDQLKYDLEQQLIQTQLVLNIIELEKESSKQEVIR